MNSLASVGLRLVETSTSLHSYHPDTYTRIPGFLLHGPILLNSNIPSNTPENSTMCDEFQDDIIASYRSQQANAGVPEFATMWACRNTHPKDAGLFSFQDSTKATRDIWFTNVSQVSNFDLWETQSWALVRGCDCRSNLPIIQRCSSPSDCFQVKTSSLIGRRDRDPESSFALPLLHEA